MDKLINIADNIQDEFDTDLVGQDYASIARDSYLTISHHEKEKLISRYYSDMRSRGSGKFLHSLIFSCLRGDIMPHKRIMSRESLKLVWIHAEDDVMKSCFYCKKCEKCNKFYTIMNECKAKGFLSFIEEVNC